MTAEIKGARILVVDDDPGMLRAVTRILGRRHEVIAVETAAEAIARAATFLPDIAVIDIYMPDTSGFELMQQLHANHPELDVIIMTGSVAQPDAHLVRAIDEGAFYFIRKPFDRRVLQTLVARCVELRRLQREKARHVDRLERELADARVFQRSMLPPARSAMQGASLNARYLACTELAGDFYDYAAAGDDHVAVIVADVAGHGAQAAMMTGIVKSAFHAAHVDGYEPRAVVERVVGSMRSMSPQRFVTLISARFDRAGGTLTFVNAGHPPGILCRGTDTPELLESTGPLISSGFTGLGWDEHTVPVSDADLLLLYTDGVMDVRGPAGLFGYRGILDHVTRSGARGGELLDGILGTVAEFSGNRPHTDDMTLLTMEFQPQPAAVGR